jgi:DNA polymerase-3 subunit gamma/tau
VSGEDLQLLYQVAVLGRRDFAYAPDPRSGLEMVLLRMLAYRPLDAAELPPEATTAAGEAAAPAKKPEPPRPGSGPGRSAAPAGAHRERAAAASPDSGPRPSAPVSVDWFELQRALPLRGVAATIAANCELLADTDGLFRFRLDPALAGIYHEQIDGRLAQALGESLGRDLRVEIETAPLQGESPAVRRQRLAEEARQRAREAIEADPKVRLLLDRFSGTLHTDSIEPLGADEDAQREGT